MNVIINKIEKALDNISVCRTKPTFIPINKLDFIYDTLNDLKKSYLENSKFSKSSLSNFKLIVKWSIDEWDWDDALTKNIWEINEVIK